MKIRVALFLFPFKILQNFGPRLLGSEFDQQIVADGLNLLT